MPITFFEIVAQRKGVDPSHAALNGADFEEHGFSIIGGCAGCGASLAAYNGHPSRTGWWLCSDCIGDSGFETTADFDNWERSLDDSD
jgi:hypothetical protein